MNDWKIVIEGAPIPWKRSGEGHSAFMIWRYDAQKAEKEAVRKKIFVQLRRMGLERSYLASIESLCVAFVFLLPVSDRLTKTTQNAKFWGLENACQKPDLDNLEKFYLDCSKGLLWNDDKSIVKLSSKKFYSQNPRTIIHVMQQKDLEAPASVEKVLRLIGPDKMKSIAHHVQELSFLTEEAVKENLPEMEEQRRREWLAWTALLLTRFARDHSADFSTLAKVGGIEEDVAKNYPPL